MTSRFTCTSAAAVAALALSSAVCVTAFPAAAQNAPAVAVEAQTPATGAAVAPVESAPLPEVVTSPVAPENQSADTASPTLDTAAPADAPNADAQPSPGQAAADPPATNSASDQPSPAPVAEPANAATEPEAPAAAVAAPASPEPIKPLVAEPAETAPQPLKVAVGAGAYGEAFKRLVVAPFTADTSIEVDPVGADAAEADVVGLDLLELERRCAAGELRDLSSDPALTARADDQVPGRASRCGVATLAWSSVFVFDPSAFGKKPPASIKDVFNVKAFPGRRALPRSGRGVLEAASVASGIPAGEVYARLATDGGMADPLAMLTALGSTNVVWYDSADEALELMRTGKASIALTSNSRAFLDSVRRGPLDVIWDGQVYDVEYLAIRAAAADPARAVRFIAFAAEPQRLAAIASEIPYGPMRRSAIALVSRHPVTGDDVQSFIPTSDDKLSTAVRFDPEWWQANGAAVALSVAEATRYRPPPGSPPLPRQRQTQR